MRQWQTRQKALRPHLHPAQRAQRQLPQGEQTVIFSKKYSYTYILLFRKINPQEQNTRIIL
jgi:hypothetical protein